jgi:hypothetical protein
MPAGVDSVLRGLGVVVRGSATFARLLEHLC